jgi:hypothetical protein
MTARHRLGGGSYAPALLLDRRSGHLADMTASGVIQQSGGWSLARPQVARVLLCFRVEHLARQFAEPRNARRNRAPRDDCFRDLDGLGADDSYGDIAIVPIRLGPQRSGLSNPPSRRSPLHAAPGSRLSSNAVTPTTVGWQSASAPDTLARTPTRTS